MDASQFNFNRFHDFSKEKEDNLRAFLAGQTNEPPIFQAPDYTHFTSMCHNKEDALSSQLDFLSTYIRLDTDLAFTYLEPWHGVGVYAAAFGCPTVYFPGEAPQVKPIIYDVDELPSLKYPNISKCESLQMILDTIAYFKDQTGGEIDISVTDTQSPNDTGSLIMDSAEFLSCCIAEPETVDPMLQSISRLICDFTEAQIECIGENFVLPGHAYPSMRSIKGLSLSDDNMAFVSPAVYEETFLPYNEIIARRFGGLHMHSCGKIAHNLPSLKKTFGLHSMECAVGLMCDPGANDACDLVPHFIGSDLILKVRCGWNEIERLSPLLRPDIRLCIQLSTTGTPEERNRQYAIAKEGILKQYHVK